MFFFITLFPFCFRPSTNQTFYFTLYEKYWVFISHLLIWWLYFYEKIHENYSHEEMRKYLFIYLKLYIYIYSIYSRGIRGPGKSGVLDMTLNCIWWWGSRSGDVWSTEYPFIDITQTSTMTLSDSACPGPIYDSYRSLC